MGMKNPLSHSQGVKGDPSTSDEDIQQPPLSYGSACQRVWRTGNLRDDFDAPREYCYYLPTSPFNSPVEKNPLSICQENNPLKKARYGWNWSEIPDYYFWSLNYIKVRNHFNKPMPEMRQYLVWKHISWNSHGSWGSSTQNDKTFKNSKMFELGNMILILAEVVKNATGWWAYYV